jgi:hypothetical protein
MYSSEYTSGFSRPAASHLTAHLLRLVTKAMSDRLLARCDTIGERTRLVYLRAGDHVAKEWLDKI